MLYLNHFDLSLKDNDYLDLDHDWTRRDLIALEENFYNSIGQPKDTPDGVAQALWAWVLDGSPWESFRNPEDVSEEMKTKLKPRSFRQELFKDHQNRGLACLSDSVSMRSFRAAC